MKRFKFTLEAVRTVRLQNEQKAMESYAAALLAKQQTLQRLDEIQHNLDTAYRELRRQMEKGCDAATASQAIAFQAELGRKRDACAESLGVAERRLNVAFQKMMETRQQREVTDKFFDNQKLKYQREEARQDQKLQDELAGRRSASVFSWNPARN